MFCKTVYPELVGAIMPIDVLRCMTGLRTCSRHETSSQAMNDGLLGIFMRWQTLIGPLNVRCQHLLASLPISSIAYDEHFETSTWDRCEPYLYTLCISSCAQH